MTKLEVITILGQNYAPGYLQNGDEIMEYRIDNGNRRIQIKLSNDVVVALQSSNFV